AFIGPERAEEGVVAEDHRVDARWKRHRHTRREAAAVEEAERARGPLEDEAPHLRMDAVAAHDDVGALLAAVVEGGDHGVGPPVETHQPLSEAKIDPASRGLLGESEVE